MSGQAGREAVRAYIDAFNRVDSSAMADAFNFPHIRLAAGAFTIIETQEDFLQLQEKANAGRIAEGWGHTVIESLEVIHQGADKVHLAVEYTRRRADDTVYCRFNSLWIATLQDGHWGIQFRSSYLPQELAQTIK
jgi:hypothetical protein